MRKSLLICGLAAVVTTTACAMPHDGGKDFPPRETRASHSAESLQPLSALAGELAPKPLALDGSPSLSHTLTFLSDSAPELPIPDTFRITRPVQELNTTYEAYFVTGTSDPSRPVYFEGEEIQRLGSMGTFGVLVDLEIGENLFTFSQGGKSSTVSITRKAAGASPISKIQQDSMFPAIHGGARLGEVIPVRCVAPSGAEVTASFGGKSVKLTQTSQTSTGYPATFTGSLPVEGSYERGVTVNGGPVTYHLTYGGSSSAYKSSGDMFIAGEGAGIAVSVTSYAGFVYPDLEKLYQIKEKVKAGAADYVVGQNNSYLKLNSGGWIPSDMVRFIEGEAKVFNSLADASSDFDDDGETYTLSGIRPPFYYGRVSDGVFYLTLYNTDGAPKPNISSSKLFSSVGVSEMDNGSVVYAFKLREGAGIWGHNISFDGGSTILRFNYRPKLSNNSAKPLEGLRVMLDPGHGGSDPGALGVAGLTGPDEKTVNLSHAYAIQDKLASLGATVTLTRSDDLYYSLDDRLKSIEDWDADLFLSIHHNSIREDADANKASGMEIYYHTAYSKNLADSMMAGLSGRLNRESRFVRQSYYRVTLMPYAPAILMELGFMSNPLEYEKTTTPDQIKQVAEAVANGVLLTLK